MVKFIKKMENKFKHKHCISVYHTAINKAWESGWGAYDLDGSDNNHYAKCIDILIRYDGKHRGKAQPIATIFVKYNNHPYNFDSQSDFIWKTAVTIIIFCTRYQINLNEVGNHTFKILKQAEDDIGIRNPRVDPLDVFTGYKVPDFQAMLRDSIMTQELTANQW